MTTFSTKHPHKHEWNSHAIKKTKKGSLWAETQNAASHRCWGRCNSRAPRGGGGSSWFRVEGLVSELVHFSLFPVAPTDWLPTGSHRVTTVQGEADWNVLLFPDRPLDLGYVTRPQLGCEVTATGGPQVCLSLHNSSLRYYLPMWPLS